MTTIITKELLSISGDVMKELKNMLKGHKKSSIPVLDTIKIEPAEKEFFFNAIYTNSDLYAVRTFESIESTIKSAFLLPIEYIKAVKGIKKADVFTFEVNEQNKLIVTGKGIKQTIFSMDPVEFPNDYTSGNYESAGVLLQNDLNKLKAAALSTSVMLSRPVLNNVLIRENKIISTDSHRLYQTGTGCSSEKDILIHKDLITYIAANEKKDFSATVKTDNHYLKIETHNARYSYRIESGNYPDVKRIIPDDFKLEFSILEYDLFKNTIEAIKAAATDKNYVIFMETEKDKIVLSNREKTINQEIQVHYNSFDSLKMAFSSLYLLDALKQLESKNISFNIVSHLRPFTVTAAENSDTLSLILPVRINY